MRPARTLLASLALVTLAALPACLAAPHDHAPFDETDSNEYGVSAWRLQLGARYDATGETVDFRVHSSAATRIELCLFADRIGVSESVRYELKKDETTDVWSARVSVSDLQGAGITGPLYYGYRAWGANWTYDATWTPGSEIGFRSDVDGAGNRFNPNKLLLDPYALEASHDPTSPDNLDGTVYGTGPQHRAKDSAKVAPKGIVMKATTGGFGSKPSRAFKDDVVYEVHVRGFTKNDPSVPADERGTYAGAARKAAYLKSIGVTAVELLPVQETQNDTNDVDVGTTGDNYWGYMTLAYFAPDRRYAADKSAGGPTREFKQMTKAFHDQDIKVMIDVVYNHTGEGGLWDGTGDVASLLSMRGLDNASYYELTNDGRWYYDNTGCGANFNTANETARDLIVDSLWYWKDVLGVDGFRFDLASVLGNTCEKGCFNFDKMDPANVLNRAVHELPARPESGGAGVDLVAEPWAFGGNSYQVGGFPSGWAEWNGVFRDTFRKDQNKTGIANVTPGQLASGFAGSSDLYADDGRKPSRSVNFLVAHDGFTLRDLYAYNGKNNGQSWPFGPSDGGEDHNNSWDQGGDAAMQRQAARNGLAILMLSSGVPMITGGDEMYRTQFGNNNAYNLDSEKNWLNWQDQSKNVRFFDFARRMMTFRGAHSALRPANFFTGADQNGNGLKDITWLTDAAAEPSGTYMDDASNHFLAFRIDGSEVGDSAQSIYVAYNGWSGKVTTNLHGNVTGKRWYRVADTSGWMEDRGNAVDPGEEELLSGTTYELSARSILVLIEK